MVSWSKKTPTPQEETYQCQGLAKRGTWTSFCWTMQNQPSAEENQAYSLLSALRLEVEKTPSGQ